MTLRVVESIKDARGQIADDVMSVARRLASMAPMGGMQDLTKAVVPISSVNYVMSQPDAIIHHRHT